MQPRNQREWWFHVKYGWKKENVLLQVFDCLHNPHNPVYLGLDPKCKYFGPCCPPSVCCLSLWNCPTRVSPLLHKILDFLCTHFVLPRKVIQGQEIDNIRFFQKNWVSACCNILLYFLLWFMSDLFCNWTGGPATSCLTIWFMNQFMPKEYELGIPGEFPHRCESLFST